MDYELAKQLKDAGFPQDLRKGKAKVRDPENHFRVIYIPTLEELIEACEKDFDYLERYTLHEREYFSAGNKNLLSQEGSSSTEAVARLWLALNKRV
jgi:hypothetical protein